jgi:Protein of unknown function (DUF2752)
MLNNYKIKYLMIFILLIIGYLYIYYFADTINGYTFCFFKNLTGIPCPSCGSTRATIFLMHGNIYDSILLNPLALVTNLLIIVSVIWMIADIVRKKETYFTFLKKDGNWKILLPILIIILLNWIWNISKGL